MTTQKAFKRRVRARMAKTGERYTAARSHLASRREQARAPDWDMAAALELASNERLTEATGRDWAIWLSILEAWGARDRTHGATVDFLTADHGVPGWYAQALTNGYERASGKRRKHQQADGFTIYASRTIGVPVKVLFDAFVVDQLRSQWLAGAVATLRSSQSSKVARFDWDGGPTRPSVTFDPKDVAKCTVAVAHERLPDAIAAEQAKGAWKARLADLKSFLESTAVAGRSAEDGEGVTQ